MIQIKKILMGAFKVFEIGFLVAAVMVIGIVVMTLTSKKEKPKVNVESVELDTLIDSMSVNRVVFNNNSYLIIGGKFMVKE